MFFFSLHYYIVIIRTLNEKERYSSHVLVDCFHSGNEYGDSTRRTTSTYECAQKSSGNRSREPGFFFFFNSLRTSYRYDRVLGPGKRADYRKSVLGEIARHTS